jgi:hypothetical protein
MFLFASTNNNILVITSVSIDNKSTKPYIERTMLCCGDVASWQRESTEERPTNFVLTGS